VVRSAEGLAEATGLAGPLLRLGEVALAQGDAAAARSLFARAAELHRSDCPLLAQLAVAQATWAGGAAKDALTLYEALLAELKRRGVAASPALLASAARVAEQAAESGRAAELEERALAAEQEHLPDLIDLRAFRQRYEWLWGRYGAAAAAALSAKDDKAIARALAGAERVWKRWREVDRENPQMATEMANLQMLAGRRGAAWLYLSSAIDEKPRDAETYRRLSGWFLVRGEREAAQGWLARAYECDTANPQWLFERAQVLDQMGRRGEAEKLYREIVGGKWAQGLQGYVERARAELRGR
jgi:Tfp pilus assembly protein PilF